MPPSEGEKLAQLTGAPLELKVDGRTYKMARLTIGMFSEWHSKLRELPFAAIEGKLASIQGKKLRERLQTELIQEAVKKSGDDTYLATLTESTEGIQILFGIMLREHQPEITDREVGALLSREGLSQITAMVTRASGIEDEDEGAGKNG